MRFQKPRWLGWQEALAVVAPLFMGLFIHRQGFDFLDDGLWLLGTRVLSDGDLLHRDLFSSYGLARYCFLLPFFHVIGRSVLALAICKAVLDGLCAGTGFLLARRLGAGLWAWLIPLGVVALGPFPPRVLCAVLLTFLVTDCLRVGIDLRRGLLLGMCWGVLCLFGVEAAGYGGVIVLFGISLGWWLGQGTPGPLVIDRRGIVGIVTGVLAVLFLMVLGAVALGIGSEATWQTLVYPLSRFADQLHFPVLDVFRDHSWLREPFAGLSTGERFESVWPGLERQRALALRLLMGLVWVIPAVAVWVGRRQRNRSWGPLIALSMAGWFSLAGHSDQLHLNLAFFCCLLLLVVLSRTLTVEIRLRRLVMLVFIASALLPLFGEKLWLAMNVQRNTLRRWDRHTAGVSMDSSRLFQFEGILAQLPWDGRSPLVCWPAQPGLNFLLDAPPGVAQSTLLDGEVRYPAGVIADLETVQPPMIILGSCRGIRTGVLDFQGLEPEIWSYLRHHYYLEQEYALGEDEFKVLVRVAGGIEEIRQKAVHHWLPSVGQYVQTGFSPDLNTGISVSQGLTVNEFDLTGITVYFNSPGPYPVERQVQFTVWSPQPDGTAVNLLSYVADLNIEKEHQRVFLNTGVLANTCGKPLIISFERTEQTGGPLHLVWNGPFEGQRFIDYYVPGQVYLNRLPVEADLNFIAY